LQRDRKNNEDQKIQPPFQNNFVNEQDEAEDPDENLENNVFKEENDISFLTFDEYEYSLMAQNESYDQRNFINQQGYNLRNRQVPKVYAPQKEPDNRDVL